MDQTLLLRLEQFQPSEEVPSKFGGPPVFFDSIEVAPYCQGCKSPLTFFAQISAPLQTDNTYNRCLYIFGCLKCPFQARAYRMQSSLKQLKLQVRADIPHLPQEFGVSAEGIQKYPEYQLEQIDSSDQEGWEQVEGQGEEDKGEVDSDQLQRMAKEAPKRDQNQDRFYYLMKEMDNPQAIYGGPPLTVKRNLEKQPACNYCGEPARHELQLNASFLARFKKLIMFDWGVLSVYTCRASCGENTHREQWVVLQDESGVIRKQSKRKKNKKSKGKKKGESKQQEQKAEQCDWD